MEELNHYQSEQRHGVEKGIKDTAWVDQDLAVKSDTQLIDSATGKKLIIRMFDFEWKKGMKLKELKEAQNHKQDIFNSYAGYIKSFLWKDGLMVREDHDPKIVFTKTGYRIAVLCEARHGLNIFEKGNTLQDLMRAHNKKTSKNK